MTGWLRGGSKKQFERPGARVEPLAGQHPCELGRLTRIHTRRFLAATSRLPYAHRTDLPSARALVHPFPCSSVSRRRLASPTVMLGDNLTPRHNFVPDDHPMIGNEAPKRTDCRRQYVRNQIPHSGRSD